MRRLADAAAEQGRVELTGMARPDDLGVTRVLRRAGLRPRGGNHRRDGAPPGPLPVATTSIQTSIQTSI
jgi:hypothetical protein